MSADIGVIGLAVMGQNLILNMNDHGFKVAAYNRTTSKVDDFLAGPALGTNIIGVHSLVQLVDSLSQPRKIMLMVRAGEVVDEFIEQLVPLLSKGDIIIDGGNSNFPDTSRRVLAMQSHGLHFVGAGVSGGEEGARYGPSIMPGGDAAAWPALKPIFEAIAAKTDAQEPCCGWVGNGGAGHFVKMVHNGIEYGDMQLISEAYHFMASALGMNSGEMKAVLEDWGKTELDSYLIQISAEILGYNDKHGVPMLDNILDAAGQKGTGKWTGINALDLGVPLTLISESVFARCLSSMKDERVAAESIFKKSISKIDGDQSRWIDDLRDALLASKIISYAQGFMLMREASQEHHWGLNYGGVAMMWRGGCIIRSAFLGNIRDAYDVDPELIFLGTDPYFYAILSRCMNAWRRVCAKSIEIGLPMPCMTSALSFIDGYTTARLPANMIQAQRDYFGAHTYERVDAPRGVFFHTDWTGQGGDVSSTSYDV